MRFSQFNFNIQLNASEQATFQFIHGYKCRHLFIYFRNVTLKLYKWWDKWHICSSSSSIHSNAIGKWKTRELRETRNWLKRSNIYKSSSRNPNISHSQVKQFCVVWWLSRWWRRWWWYGKTCAQKCNPDEINTNK